MTIRRSQHEDTIENGRIAEMVGVIKKTTL